MEVSSVVSSIKGAIELVKKLADIAKDMKHAELKKLIADLSNELADAHLKSAEMKIELLALREENQSSRAKRVVKSPK